MDYFYNLDYIICEEVIRERRIAIYPFGKFGMQAKEILKQRYGKEAIIIDNKLAKYNPKIITFNQFRENVDGDVTVILTATDPKLNEVLLQNLNEKESDLITIRNILDPIVKAVPDKAEYFRQIKNLCTVRKVKEYELVRVGKENDGAYIMVDDINADDIAYSFGIGDNISWDKYIADKGIRVYCYDPTISELPENYPGLLFSRIGIAGKDNASKRLYSIQTILENNGHEKKENLILKMDVEGAEWDFLEEAPSELLGKFTQMTFELHDITNIENAEKIISVLQKIRMTHTPVWIHANNVDGVIEEAEGVRIPRLLEITFVKNNKYELCDTAYSCPISIDMPNVQKFKDCQLGNWGAI